MSKRQRVVKLVEDIIGLKAQIEEKEQELDTLLGPDKPGKPGKPTKPAASASTAPTSDRILHMMESDRSKPVTAPDAVERLGITDSAFGYNIKQLITSGKVKRVKRGHYQIRGHK